MMVLPTADAEHGGRHASRPHAAIESAELYSTFDEGIPFVTGSGHPCFALEAGATNATIELDDALGVPVRASYNFFTADGEHVAGDGTFCGSVTLALPSDAACLDVWPFSSFAPLTDCPVVATAGYVRAAFS